MSEFRINNIQDIDIKDLMEAANDVLVCAKDNAEYFEGLKKKKWYYHLWNKITFSKESDIRKAQGVSDLAKLQDIIVTILIQLSNQITAVSDYVNANTDLIKELTESNLYIKQQQSLIIDVLRQIKFQTTEVPELSALPQDDIKIICASIKKLANTISSNEQTQQYFQAVHFSLPNINFDFDFEKLECIENLNSKSKQRLAIMFYEYICLSETDYSINSDILNMISQNMKDKARTRVIETEKLYGKGLFIKQFEKKNELNSVSDDGIIFVDTLDFQKIDKSKINREVNALLLGKAGTEKNSLIRSIYKYFDVSASCSKISNEYNCYSDDSGMLKFIDSPVIEIGNEKDMLQNVTKITQDNNVNIILYCVNNESKRFEAFEINFVKQLRELNKCIQVIIVITQCYDQKSAGKLKEYIRSQTNHNETCMILTDDYETDAGNVPSFGISKLLEKMVCE